MKRILLALFGLLLISDANASTSPVMANSVAPSVDAPCSITVSPANVFMWVPADGALYWCNPTPRGAPSLTRWQLLLSGGVGTDGTFGLKLDINTSVIENPPGNKGTFGWFGSPAQPGYRRAGENTYKALWTNGGVYGPITCTTGTCTLNTNSVDGTHLSLTSQATGTLMKYNGTDWVVVPLGTSLQVLRMNAGATDIEWGASAAGGDSVKVNNTDVTDPDLHGSPGEGGLPQSVDIEVVNCTGNDAPSGKACLAAGDVNFRYAAASIEDGDINSSAAIQNRKVLSTGTSNFAMVYAGDPALMTTDTGNALCTDSLVNKTCVTTFEETSNTERTCAFTQTIKFRAWCK